MEPFCDNGDKMVDIRVVVNGKVSSIAQVWSNQLPHESEMEALHRLGMNLIRGIKDKERHQDCCACCVEKRSCC